MGYTCIQLCQFLLGLTIAAAQLKRLYVYRSETTLIRSNKVTKILYHYIGILTITQ